jgi:hypothetical protein
MQSLCNDCGIRFKKGGATGHQGACATTRSGRSTGWLEQAPGAPPCGGDVAAPFLAWQLPAFAVWPERASLFQYIYRSWNNRNELPRWRNGFFGGRFVARLHAAELGNV